MNTHLIIKIGVKFLVITSKLITFLYIFYSNINSFLFAILRFCIYTIGIIRMIKKARIIKAQNIFIGLRIQISVFQKLLSRWFGQFRKFAFINLQIWILKLPYRSSLWDKLICKKTNAIYFTRTNFSFY